MPDTTQAITHKAIKSTKWVFLSTGITKIWQPIVTIILARLLVPADFGLMALATIAISFISLFQDMGLNAALIQCKDRIKEAANIVFWTNMGMGVLLYLMLFVSAPYIAIFFENKDVANILRVIGLTFLIIPLGSVPLVLLSKELEFRKLFYFDIIPAIVPGTISIIFAFSGYGVWALVYGSLSGRVLTVIAVWCLNNWRPVLRCDFSILKYLLRFGSYVSVESIQLWGLNTIDNIFVGRFFNSGQLGIYSMGFSIAFMLPSNILTPMSRLLFPTLSKLQDNIVDIQKVCLRVLKINTLISFPLGLFLILSADKLVPVFLGDKWVPIIPVIKLLAPYGMVASIVGFSTTVYKAIGRPDIMPKFYTARLLVSVPAYYFAAQKGLISLCITHLILVSIFAPINFYIFMKVLRIKTSTVINTFKDIVICCFLSAVMGYLLTGYISSKYYVGDITHLITFMLIFALLYLLLLQSVGRKTYGELKKILYVAIT